MKLTDIDGIDGPFDRAMDRAMREDRAIAEHLKACDCGGCRAFDAQRFGEMRSVVGHSASDFRVAPLTADTITDEQIRELRAFVQRDPWSTDGDPDFIVRICDRALRTTAPGIYVTAEAQAKADADYLAQRRPAARARCAEILEARRRSEAK